MDVSFPATLQTPGIVGFYSSVIYNTYFSQDDSLLVLVTYIHGQYKTLIEEQRVDLGNLPQGEPETKTLSISPFTIRLARDVWSMGIRLRQATNEYPSGQMFTANE